MKSRKIVAIIMMAIMIIAVPLSVSAASSNPYKDVTKKSVGKDAYRAITYDKKHNAYSGIFTGKKFYPSKKITRRQFIGMLNNFYGSKNVPVTISDVLKANKTITAKWACNKMVAVAKKMGITITWKGNSKVLTRALASQYLYVFAHYDSAFKPRK